MTENEQYRPEPIMQNFRKLLFGFNSIGFYVWHYLQGQVYKPLKLIMLIHNIRLSVRKLLMDKSFSLLSVLGLSLAMAACAILVFYVRFEKSYDNFRDDTIYRISYHGFQNDVEVGKSAQIIPALAPAVKNEIADIEMIARFAHTAPFMADPVMQSGDKQFRESRIYFAEKDFLSLFGYKMTSGSADKALLLPDQVVLSSTTAKKYFGDADPVGKSLTFHQGERGIKNLLITGVFEDVPVASHFHTDFLVSFSTLGLNLDQDWDWGNFYTYIKIREGADAMKVQSMIPAVLEKYVGQMIAHLAAERNRVEFQLQPIHDIHLQSQLWAELEPNGDQRIVNFLQVIAILIMVIAWINYINFSVAKSSEGSRTISIRKISGSSRSQLIMELLTDTAVVNAIAVLLAMAMIQISLPFLKHIIGLPPDLSMGWKDVSLLFGSCLVSILLSGLYPAIFVSRFNPVTLLKTKISRSATNLRINKALIVFQFAASIVLIIGTIVVFRQLNFMRDRDLGMNIDQTLIVKGPAVKDSTYRSLLNVFANEVRTIKGVSSFTVSSSIPGEEIHWGRSFSMKENSQNSIGASILAVDENFFTSYGIRFLAGEDYPDGTFIHQHDIVVNETMAYELGYPEADKLIGKVVLWSEGDREIAKTVIGVAKDFNQQSLRNKVQPIVFSLKEYMFAPWAGEYYSFKIEADQKVIASLEKIWKRTFQQNPFDYFFLDQYYDAQYKSDARFGKIFLVFSILAIFIACLGLFGLTAYMTTTRTKEIGIRKVLGSTSFQLVQLLTRSYLVLVAFAIVIACPVSIYLIKQWQSQFAYQVEITPWVYVAASLVALFTALLTVGIKSWKASLIDPAQTLKYE